MAKTRKVQVTLDEEQYEQLERIAERDDRSLAGVVRESIVRYCIEPAERRRRNHALDRLFAIGEGEPDDYTEWEREYSRNKARTGVPEDVAEDAPS